MLIARGEFSIVIAALGSELADGPDLGALAAAYVLLTAIVGPLAARYSDSLPGIPAFSAGRTSPVPGRPPDDDRR